TCGSARASVVRVRRLGNEALSARPCRDLRERLRRSRKLWLRTFSGTSLKLGYPGQAGATRDRVAECDDPTVSDGARSGELRARIVVVRLRRPTLIDVMRRDVREEAIVNAFVHLFDLGEKQRDRFQIDEQAERSRNCADERVIGHADLLVDSGQFFLVA